jgi:hypothetical protein
MIFRRPGLADFGKRELSQVMYHSAPPSVVFLCLFRWANSLIFSEKF